MCMVFSRVGELHDNCTKKNPKMLSLADVPSDCIEEAYINIFQKHCVLITDILPMIM